MCDQIAIIDQGRLVACGETKGLIQKLDEKRLMVTTIEPIERLPEPLRKMGAVILGDHQLEIHYRPSQARVGELLDVVRAEGLSIRDLATAEADLEELFLRLTSGNGDRIDLT